MTENEAIKYLEFHKKGLHDTGYNAECVNFAIKALEEIQQYRAIGTVEDIKFLVENVGSIKLLKEYNAIGTIEEFKALKEKKQKKKKSNKVIFSHDSYAYCPHCHHNVKLLWASHCDKCGGELDWKDRKLQAN